MLKSWVLCLQEFYLKLNYCNSLNLNHISERLCRSYFLKHLGNQWWKRYISQRNSWASLLQLFKLFSLTEIPLQNLVIQMRINRMAILGGKCSSISWFPGILFTSFRWKEDLPGSHLLSRNESLFEMQAGLPGREIWIREWFGLKGTSGHNLVQPPGVEWVKCFVKGREWQLWPPSSLSLNWFYKNCVL